MSYWVGAVETLGGGVGVKICKMFLHGFPLCGLQLDGAAFVAAGVVGNNDILRSLAGARAQ